MLSFLCCFASVGKGSGGKSAGCDEDDNDDERTSELRGCGLGGWVWLGRGEDIEYGSDMCGVLADLVLFLCGLRRKMTGSRLEFLLFRRFTVPILLIFATHDVLYTYRLFWRAGRDGGGGTVKRGQLRRWSSDRVLRSEWGEGG